MAFEEKLLEMYKSAPTGADITMTIRFIKEQRTISNRKEGHETVEKTISNKNEEEQLDWQKALPTMILPEKDYATFDEMELEARRIMKAAETKGILLEREIAERNRPSPSPVSSSIYEMYFPIDTSSSLVILNSEDTKTSRTRKKKRTRDTRSSDLRLVNSDGQTATFFDVDSCSLKTDEMFQ